MANKEYVSPIPVNAVGFTPIRYLKNGCDRLYETATFEGDKPNMILDQIYRQMKVFGCVAKTDEDTCGMLDLINNEDDIVGHVSLTRKGVRWLCKKYGLRMVDAKREYLYHYL